MADEPESTTGAEEDCEDITEQAACEAMRGCAWENDACDDGWVVPETCAEAENRFQCNAVDGCVWQGDACTEEGGGTGGATTGTDAGSGSTGDEGPPTVCEELEDEGECEDSDGCTWNTDEQACTAV